MLLPQAYDVAWTGLTDAFNGKPSPGSIVLPGGQPAVGTATGLGPSSAGQVMTANPLRACLILQNNSATGGPVLWFNFGAPAVANAGGSFSLQPGGSLVIAQPKACPKESVYVAWSGAGTQLGAFYQNSLPQSSVPVSSEQGWQGNIGAQAWGYAAPPPAPAPPAPAARNYAGFVPINTPP